MEPIAVKILGQVFSVASDDGADHIRRVAEYVDRKMEEIAANGRTNSSLSVAVMAALNIASEYQKLKDEREQLEQLIDRLTSRLAGHGPRVV